MSQSRLAFLAVALSLVITGTPRLALAQAIASPVFAIHAFEVPGNTLLDPASIDQALAPYRGANKNFGDIQQALEALEARYRDAGYSTVQVLLPEQELQNGVVRFQVIEKKLGQVHVEGAHFFDQDNIRNSFPGLEPGTLPRLDDISRSLRIANENPAKKVVLQLSATDDTTVDAHLQVTDQKPWKIGAQLDNTGSEATGKTRLGVLLQHANLFNRDHVMTFQYTTSPEKSERVSIYGLGYHVPLYAWGDSIDLFGAYSDVDSGTLTAGVLNLSVSGKGSVYGARYNQTLPRIGDYEQKIIYGLDYRAYENNIGFAGTPLGHDITVRPLSISYVGTWSTRATVMTGFLSATRNIPGGSNGDSDAFNLARAGAPSDYSILRYGVSGYWSIPHDWQIRANFSGQSTPDKLVAGEQFGLGGASSVRGFQEREFADDKGYLFSTELYTPELCAQRFNGNCRLLAFYDYGKLRRNDALPGEKRSGSLASAGLGLRLQSGEHVSLRLDLGQILDDNETGSKGNTRLHFLLSVSY